MLKKFFKKAKDGGPESPVDAYFLCEFKGLFSIALLKFNEGGRDNYHSHAFSALTWFICGDMVEENKTGKHVRYRRSILPKCTPREQFHRVLAHKDSWCFTLRGPWRDEWMEYDPHTSTYITLTHGREVVNEELLQEESRS